MIQHIACLETKVALVDAQQKERRPRIAALENRVRADQEAGKKKKKKEALLQSREYYETVNPPLLHIR